MDEVSSTPSTASSTPAPAAASPASSSTVNGTMSASEALTWAASSAATPESESVSSSAGTAVPPDDSGLPTPDDLRSPTIPRTRFDEVNQRMQAAEQALKGYDWAKDIPETARTMVPGAVQLAQAIDRDPVGTIAALTQHAASDPQMAQALRSHMARLLATRTPQADPEPEPDLQTGDGTPVYSAKQLREWQAWNAKRLTQSLDGKLKPFEQMAQMLQQREAQATATTTVTQALTTFRSANPDVTDAHLADVREAIASDPRLLQVADTDPALALELGWSRVYRAKVQPDQQRQSEGQVLAHLQQRAVAATVNPAASATTTPPSTIGNARAALAAAGV